jgi:hypothetical protein
LDDKWELLASWLPPRSERPPSQLKASMYDTTSLPTRILDLSRVDQVVLREYSGNQYVALSHRWGTFQHLIAKTNTLQQLKSGIPVELLPATFRDAVFTARRLGVYSLWIDALCIVQDDQDEWQNEARKMGDIYTNADLSSLFIARQMIPKVF